MEEQILAGLEAYFPSVRKHMVEYRFVGDFELIAKMPDGHFMLFDSLTNSIRHIPAEYENGMTEEEARREFGIRLRRMLERKGITQRDLSIKTGISPVLLSNYIVGKRSPSYYNLLKIVKELNCSLDDFRFTF